MKKIKLIKRGDRLFVHPSKLTPNKLNAKIYNTEQDRETIEKLAKDFGDINTMTMYMTIGQLTKYKEESGCLYNKKGDLVYREDTQECFE